MKGVCLECSAEFKDTEMDFVKEEWVCPNCHSPNVEKKPPYKYDRVNVKYEEGEGH